MDSGVGKSVTEFSVTTVSWSRSDGVGRIQILDGQRDVLGPLCVFSKIINHELSQIEILFISTLIYNILLDAHLLPDNFSVVINQSLFGALSNDDYAVSLGLCNFNYVFVDSFRTV